ncbi:MAG: DUF952 domain-containing protein [Chloroflexi bacterium]|nr:DUF952 domain-containing protein [Chloroflexota bacterium]
MEKKPARKRKHLFHITTRAEWQRAQRVGAYRAASLRREGFIHCSGQTQVVRVANAFYRGKRNLVLLLIEPAKVNAPIRHERVDGRRFPHIYGALNLDAVVQVVDFPPRADGTFVLPKW